MQQEAFTLTLSVGGEYAGQQHWHTQPDQEGQGGFVTRVETQFDGILPAVRQLQISHYGPDYQSLHFSEQEGSGRGKPAFESSADPGTGLLTLRQGRDEAVSALLAPHYDPVSLLLLLRSPQAPREPWHASMTGGRVHVQPLVNEPFVNEPLPDDESWGAGATRHYLLRPGGARVVVEAQPPYRIVYLWQPTDFGGVAAQMEAEQGTPAPKVRRRVQPNR